MCEYVYALHFRSSVLRHLNAAMQLSTQQNNAQFVPGLSHKIISSHIQLHCHVQSAAKGGSHEHF